MKSLRFAFALVALSALSLTPRLVADELSGADLYDKCVKSTVFIVTPLKGGYSMGSGSLIDAEKRYIITNAHVVHDEDIVFCQFPVRLKDGSLMTNKQKYIERVPAGQALRGKVLYRDQSRDLALVQLDKLPPDTPAIPLAKKSVKVGEYVMNIGNPGKVEQTFSTGDGKVRAVGVEDMVVHGSDGAHRIQARMVTVTIPINPGDSGGPIIDKRGYQVAVTESGYSGAAAQNVNSCVDVTEVWAFLAEKKVTIKILSTEPDKPEPAPKIGPTKPKTPPKTDTPPAVTPPPKNGEAPPPAAGPTAEDEKKASELLQKAKLFKDDDKDYFAGKLKDIIAKYPATAAGKEAKKLLDGLK